MLPPNRSIWWYSPVFLHLEEDEKARPKHRGLKCNRKNSKPMQRMKGHVMLYTDYFTEDSTYTPKEHAQLHNDLVERLETTRRFLF
jgi:hypothetical protein